MVYPICRIAVFALLVVQLVLQVNIVSAQNLVTFDSNAAGIDKSVGSWGVDAAWPSYDNVRISINNLGLQNVDFVRVNFYTDEALTSTGELGPEARSRLDAQLALADLAGDVPIGILPNSGDGTDGYYFNNGTDNSQGLRVDRWVNVIRATRDYISNQTGRSLKFVEPFNEPDYLANQGSREQLGEITAALAADSSFNGTELLAASTLRANNNAYFWYDGARGPATAGSTHLLDGEADGDFRVLEAYANFLGNYIDPNDDAWNPEVHSMAEILVGAEVGMDGGSVWGAAMRNRGLAMQASDGKRLGYAADYENESAAAVYRAPTGQIYAFAGGVERAGGPSSYKITSTDGPVYFNGIGPIESFTMLTEQDQSTYVEIDTTAEEATAPLDGFRWKIVNRATGEVLDVNNLGTNDGDNIQLWQDNGQDNQRWDIRQVFHQYDGNTPLDGYFEFINANSGKTAEVANFSLADGGNVQQFGAGGNLTRLWYIEKTGDGFFHIRNANSASYLSGAGGINGNAVQRTDGSSLLSQWQFVLSNPDLASDTRASLGFDGNTGSATTFGNPSYGEGVNGSAIILDGNDDYVQLASDVANTPDITIAARVKWDGGDAWQRIFDFGNSTDEYMFLTPSSGDGTLRFGISMEGYLNEQFIETDALEISEWHHIAITLGGNTGILYIDGVAVTAGQFSIDPSDFNPSLNYIGRSQFNDPLFAGMIDDFGVYGFALSPDQVLSLASVPEPASGLVLLSLASVMLLRRRAAVIF